MDLVECSLCNNKYDEGKCRARTLPCVHYFCQDCLDRVIMSDTPHCPLCRRRISAADAQNLPPNYLMDELISKMKSGKVLVNTAEAENDDDDDIDIDIAAGWCQKHKSSRLYFKCKKHNKNICRECTVIDHPASQCQIISLEDEMEEIKAMAISNLESQKLHRVQNSSDLQKMSTDAELDTRKKKQEIARLQIEINANEQVMKLTNEAIQNCMANIGEIDLTQGKLSNSKTISQIKQSCEYAEHVTELSKSLGMLLERDWNLAPSNSLQDLINQSPDKFTNKILHGGVTVHTTANINGQKRFSQLIVKNGVIHFPALAPYGRGRSTAAPDNTVTVSSLLTLYPATNADIYLTLAAEGKELGTVYVELMDIDSAKYTRKLCMGIIGPSYRGAIFDGKSLECLYTGNIKDYDPSRCLERHPRPVRGDIKKGTAYIAHDTGLGFVVSRSLNFQGYAVGLVTKNMNVLDVAFKYSKGKINIKDVGIVLKS